ncbi:MAG: hypothetical protein IKL07_01215, partial [Clostridium sp.]|nr:hypothetical protein [Clostridium sp.]
SEMGANTDGIRVQYKETDWQFILRMASEIKLSIIPEFSREGIWYYLGVDESQIGKEIAYSRLCKRNDMGRFSRKVEMGLTNLQTNDATYYSVTTREVLDLGQAVLIKGKKLYVYKAVSEWKEEQLIHHYDLRTKNSFLQNRIYNSKIIGASLSGSVSAISKDRVQVSLGVDSSNPNHGSHFFPYSTVYSSASGTGWYCMPEPGDSIRLYFPSAKEAEAYVLSSVHLDSSMTSKNQRNDPDTKSIRSVHDKEVCLAKDKLVLTNHDGMKVELNDKNGIIIESDKDVIIKAKENMKIEGEQQLKMIAGDTLLLNQGNAKLTLAENKITLSGAKVKLQE